MVAIHRISISPRAAGGLPVWFGAHTDSVDNGVDNGERHNFFEIGGAVRGETFYSSNMWVNSWILGLTRRNEVGVDNLISRLGIIVATLIVDGISYIWLTNKSTY
jgi:hypothetical protein